MKNEMNHATRCYQSICYYCGKMFDHDEIVDDFLCNICKGLREDLRTKRVRKDGTVEGCVVETYLHTVDEIFVCTGDSFITMQFDNGAVNGEIRITRKMVNGMLNMLKDIPQ